MATPLNPDFVASLAKKLGMTVTDDEIVCTGRPGIVYLHVGEVIRPLMLHSSDGTPVVCECEHQALEMVQEYYMVLARQGLEALLDDGDLPYLPEAEEFVYVHTVDVEDTTAVTPQAKAEADRVLAAMKGVAL